MAQRIGCRNPWISQRKATVTSSNRTPKKTRRVTCSFIRCGLFRFGPPREALGERFLVPMLGRPVPMRAAERVRKVLLSHRVAALVVIVPIAYAVAYLLHEARRRIAHVHGHRFRRITLDGFARGIPRTVDAVRLGRRGEIDDGLGDRELAFRGAEKEIGRSSCSARVKI